MPKQKRDYSALYLEFIESDFDEVKSFITHKWIVYNAERGRRTKGRGKKKQEHKRKIVEDTLKENAKRQAKELAMPLEDIMKWKKAILWLLINQVSKYVKDSKGEDWKQKDIDVWNAEKILKMFKTELWEPSTIWTNYNLNANKIEWLTEEESEALDILFSKSQNWKKSNK